MGIFSFIVLLFGLVMGQLAAWEVSPGIRVFPFDLIIFCMAVWFAYTGRRYTLWHTAMLPFAAAITVSLGSALFFLPAGVVLGGSLYGLRWLLYASLVAITTQSGLSRGQMATGLYGLAVAMAAAGMVQLVWYPDLRYIEYLGWDPHFRRLAGTLLDPNFTGILMVLGFLLGLILMRSAGLLSGTGARRQAWGTIMGIFQVVLVVGIVLTFSRSSYLALVAGVGVWAWRTKALKTGVWVVGILVATAVLLPRNNEWHNLFRTTSSVARMENSQNAFRLFLRSPLFGHGFNTLRYVQCGSTGCPDRYGNLSHAAGGVDNSMLFILATTGSIGLIAYGYMVYVLGRCVQTVKNPRDNHYQSGLYASAGALFVHGMFTNSWFYPWVMIWMWLLVGTALRLGERKRREQKITKKPIDG